MGPRGFTLPPASTNSAKAFRRAFYCDLCSRGYSRQNEFDAHELSYDHLHKKRLKAMKSMQKEAQQPSKVREERGPLVQIKLGGVAARTEGGAVKKVAFKKGGFKSAFGLVGVEQQLEEQKRDVVADMGELESEAAPRDDSDFTDEEDYYDPRQPTGCLPGCNSKVSIAAGTT